MGKGKIIATLSNKDVVDMLASGLSPATVIGVIYEVPKATFDVSVSGLVSLGNAKVPDTVLHAMMTKLSQLGG